MPYIRPEDRYDLTPGIGKDASNAGELNFQISKVVNEYWARRTQNYQTINDIVGALDNAKFEFQRRIVSPYEDIKLKLNGDVYEDVPEVK